MPIFSQDFPLWKIAYGVASTTRLAIFAGRRKSPLGHQIGENSPFLKGEFSSNTSVASFFEETTGYIAASRKILKITKNHFPLTEVILS